MARSKVNRMARSKANCLLKNETCFNLLNQKIERLSVVVCIQQHALMKQDMRSSEEIPWDFFVAPYLLLDKDDFDV